jgi:hypothetical protein
MNDEPDGSAAAASRASNDASDVARAGRETEPARL